MEYVSKIAITEKDNPQWLDERTALPEGLHQAPEDMVLRFSKYYYSA